jgi:hypothetical protein
MIRLSDLVIIDLRTAEGDEGAFADILVASSEHGTPARVLAQFPGARLVLFIDGCGRVAVGFRHRDLVFVGTL